VNTPATRFISHGFMCRRIASVRSTFDGQPCLSTEVTLRSTPATPLPRLDFVNHAGALKFQATRILIPHHTTTIAEMMLAAVKAISNK
jgi:hypothetical protein